MALNYTTPATLASTSFSALAPRNTTAGAAAGCAAKETSVTNNIVDAHVVVKVVTPAFTPSTTTAIDIYVVGSVDGTNWPGALASGEVITSSDATITLSSNGNNLLWLSSILCHNSAGTFTSEPLSVASRFGGVMPKFWKIVIQNSLPATISLTSGTVTYTEVYYN